MPQPNPAATVTLAGRASDLDRVNTLASLLNRIYVVVRAYLVQRSRVSLALVEHFSKQRAIGDTDTAQYVREDRAELDKFAERIRSLVDEALPIIRTAAPLARYGLGESAGQYLTEVAMRLNEIVGTVGEDLKMLEIAIAVECKGPYAPWMNDGSHLFSEPIITDLLKHDLLPKLYEDALRFGSLAMPSESKGRTQRGCRHKADTGNRLKRDVQREFVLQFLKERGRWEGTLTELRAALKGKGLDVSEATLSRYLKGTKHDRHGKPRRAARVVGKLAQEREPVTDESDLDAWTMPDDPDA